jgi:hypothetical protein
MAEKYPVTSIALQQEARKNGVPEVFVRRSIPDKLIIAADDTKIYDAERGMLVCDSPDGDLPGWEQPFTPPEGMEPAYLVIERGNQKTIKVELRPKRYVPFVQ